MGVKGRLPIAQWVFAAQAGIKGGKLDKAIHRALMAIVDQAYTDEALNGLYPLSMSAQMQVLKGRLNSNEIIPYFVDLNDSTHSVHTLYFHTRFSTNTDPHPSMAQPFRMMAHNGELNTFLLYTSDDADELPSVELVGQRRMKTKRQHTDTKIQV